MTHDDRHGAKQPARFDPAKAARLDDPARFAYLRPDDVLALLDPPQGATVVDFGTGTGTYALEIARRRPDLNVVALDEQPEMLAFLEAKLETAGVRNVRPANGDTLAALRSTAERVLALNVLHELGDDALRALGSLLAPGGLALFLDWNGDVERPVGPPRDHVYGANEARAHLEARGFRVSRAREFPYHHAFLARVET